MNFNFFGTRIMRILDLPDSRCYSAFSKGNNSQIAASPAVIRAQHNTWTHGVHYPNGISINTAVLTGFSHVYDRETVR